VRASTRQPALILIGKKMEEIERLKTGKGEPAVKALE
jgi:hypothetical protein